MVLNNKFIAYTFISKRINLIANDKDNEAHLIK